MKLEYVPSVREVLDESAEKFADKPFVKFIKDGEIQEKSFKRVREDCLCLSRMLRDILPEKSHIAIIGKTNYEYIVCALGVLISGCVAVPTEPEYSAEEAAAVFNDADITAVFYGDEFSDRIEKVRELCPDIIYTFNMSTGGAFDGIYNEYSAVSENASLSEIECDTSECALIIYTSGTTGDKKGVMLSQYALISNLIFTPYSDIVVRQDVILTVLPLHHIFCFVAGLLGPLRLGSCLCLNGEMRDLFKNLLIFKPDQMRVVPLIAKGLLARINAVRAKNPSLSPKAAAAAVTGGNLDMLLSGGAYLDPALCQAFEEYGIFWRQGYGMSEAGSKVSVPDFDCVPESVGRLMDTVEARIADGELQIKTPSMMLGYYKRPEETKKAVTEDGFLRTGDIAFIDENRQLFITGRLKNLIILSNGENVSPEEIENRYKCFGLVSEVMVYAEKDIIAAEIYPDFDYAEKNGIADIRAALEEITDELNSTAVSSHTVARVIVSEKPLEKTALGKIKRKR